MNRKELDILIARYFDAETSVEEEKTLLRELLSLKEHNPASEEALAVMGYIRTAPEPESENVPHKKTQWKIFSAVAAAAAVIAVMSVYICWALIIDHPVSEECLAYVAGEKVEDYESVMRLMSAQLDEMGEASDNVRDIISSDLDDFRSVFSE